LSEGRVKRKKGKDSTVVAGKYKVTQPIANRKTLP